jgi:hypothetical protein
MGLFDEVYWEPELPEGHPAGHRSFQTKSLECCLECYVVTKEGRLINYPPGYEFTDGKFDGALEPAGVDVEFHGDIKLASFDGEYREYIARFTHGTLEWIRQRKDIPPRKFASRDA